MRLTFKVSEDSTPLASPATAQERWDQIKQTVDAQSPASATTTSAPYSPPSNPLDAKDMAMYGARPLEHGQNIVKCGDCQKPILESAVQAHAAQCSQAMERSQQRKSSFPAPLKRRLSDASVESNPSPPKKVTPSLILTHNKSGGIVSAATAASAPVNAVASSSKKESGRIKQRPSTVDVDIHCGVALDKGYPCSRSLTCKTHSMGAKRSVPGRSQAYDVLLHAWNVARKGEDYSERKSLQARLGTGASSGKKRKGDHKDHGGDRRTIRERGKTLLVVGEWEDEDEGLGPGEEMLVDSEDEMEKVMGAIGTGPFGIPLVSPNLGGRNMFSGRNLKLARLRCHLNGVFGGGTK